MNQTHVDETFLKLEEGLERTFNFHAASVRKNTKKRVGFETAPSCGC